MINLPSDSHTYMLLEVIAKNPTPQKTTDNDNDGDCD